MWLYGWEPLTVSHHADNFDGFNHCGSGDNVFLICHVISKDHVFKVCLTLCVEACYS